MRYCPQPVGELIPSDNQGLGFPRGFPLARSQERYFRILAAAPHARSVAQIRISFRTSDLAVSFASVS
jgi:hypothetical protein